MLDARLAELAEERHARVGSIGVFVEGAYFAKLAEIAGCAATAIPEYLAKAEAWGPMCQAAALHVGLDRVTISQMASERIESAENPAPFRAALSASFGKRDEDDPTVSAFVLGIVLGLDETLARPAKPKRAKVNSNRGGGI